MSCSQKLFNEARQQGHEQGHILGQQQGRNSALIETAIAMMAQGFDLKIIQKITQLSDLELECLIND